MIKKYVSVQDAVSSFMPKAKFFDRTLLILNDIHLPFEREDVLREVQKHAERVDAVVLGGDTLDCHSISSFPKIEHMTLSEELVYAHNFFVELEKILGGKPIIAINGNHEERLYKEITRLNNKHLQKLMNPNVLEMFVDGFTLYVEEKKRRYKPIKSLRVIPSWYVNIDNKVIVAHPKSFSRVKGKYLENLASYFVNQNEQFDMIVGGHTHKFATGIVDRHMGKYVIESGCLCQPMPYANNGKLGYTPQSYCYTIVQYNYHEPLDINDQQVIHLPKTDVETREMNQFELR